MIIAKPYTAKIDRLDILSSCCIKSVGFIKFYQDIRLVDKSLDNQLASSFFTTSNKSAYTCCNLPVFGCTKACGESLRSHHSSLIILHTSFLLMFLFYQWIDWETERSSSYNCWIYVIYCNNI